VGLVARGATRPKNPWKAQLQPFQPLVLSWQGRSDLKTLTDAELRPAPPLTGQSRLYCGFYLNELVQRLVPEHEPVPELFAAYLTALHVLQGGDDIEQGLRDFEQQLVTTLGYGFKWDWATDLDAAVLPDHDYAFDPQQGITAAPGTGTLMRGLPGGTLVALGAGRMDSPEARRLAKQVMRRLIDFLLQGRPLQSRRLFTDAKGDFNDP
jgi:DNA repair protein RecO (recombination protein O)